MYSLKCAVEEIERLYFSGETLHDAIKSVKEKYSENKKIGVDQSDNSMQGY